MTSFGGFPAGKLRLTPIPDLFFSELLPTIDHMGELQVVLYMFWFLRRQTGYPRYMTLAELEGEGLLLTTLECGAGEDADPLALLHEAVQRALQRKALLSIVIGEEPAQETYLFLNTAQGRRAIDEVMRGQVLLEKSGRVRQPHLPRERPNIFRLYEDNIGLLQPLLAEELAEAARDYPAQWIEEAFKLAVEANVRNWRYVRAVLDRWAVEGRDDWGRGPNALSRR